MLNIGRQQETFMIVISRVCTMYTPFFDITDGEKPLHTLCVSGQNRGVLFVITVIVVSLC